MGPSLQTIGQIFLHRSTQSGTNRAIGWFEDGTILFMTYKEYKEAIQLLSMGFKEIGVGPDTKVSILSNTRKEWHFCDLAILTARAITVPIYHTYTSHEIKYIFNHSESSVLVVENDEQLEKVLKVQDELRLLTHIILLDQVSKPNREQIRQGVQVYTLDKFLKLGEAATEKDPSFFEKNIREQKADEIASIIYTSGTTGEPKGVVITHEAFVCMMKNVITTLGSSFGEKDRTLTWLPLSHVFGRCESMLNLLLGWEMVFAEGIDKLIDNLAQAKPTALLAVPRIFEKIYAKIMDQVNSGSPLKKRIFQWANTALTHYHDQLAKDLSPTPLEILQAKLAYRLVFKKIYDRFGGKIRYFISGGAPISIEIVKFLQNANLLIMEGYGLTETVAPCTLNPPKKRIPGTVGVPLGDVEIKMADDGEIMVKTKALFREYYKDPQATSEVLKEGGWFYTGDIGEFTSEGYLRITDRKKDIIVTSGGKNVAPQKIENMLKLQKYISHPVVVGDRQKFLSALIGIEKETFAGALGELKLDGEANINDLATNHQVHNFIESNIATVNKELPSFETIKKFYIVPEEFTVDNGFVTPSLKVRKKNVIKAYQQEIDKMYEAAPPKAGGPSSP